MSRKPRKHENGGQGPASGRAKTTKGRLAGWPAAAAVLILFWAALVAAQARKSATYDEPVHLLAGSTYWRLGDYRINPENGNLPQRVGGLGPAALRADLPDTHAKPMEELWKSSEQWGLANHWLYRMGNDAGRMLLSARACMALLAVALGAIVYAWSRKLFGLAGGMISLALYVLNPTVLANGALVASDLAGALFFAAALAGVWAVLHRLTLWRVLLSGLAVGGLLVSKMSAPLIVPMALALVVVRLLRGGPLMVSLPRRTWQFGGRARQAIAFAAAAVSCAIIAWIVVWAFYGFRYSMFAPGQGPARPAIAWERLLDRPLPYSLLDARIGLTSEQEKELAERILPAERQAAAAEPDEAWRILRSAYEDSAAQVLLPAQRDRLNSLLAGARRQTAQAEAMQFCRRHRLLPEAFLYGYAHVLHYAKNRFAFFNGQYSTKGWRSFFPYTFLVKTPLALLALLCLAIVTAARRWAAARREQDDALVRIVGRALYATAPLWVLMAVYWAVSITSGLNIGHRHILPVYPSMFVLAGTLAWWLRPRSTAAARGAIGWLKARPVGTVVLALVASLAIEAALSWPNYLAYFNGIVRPSQAWRHLVDSSLDWGQDLPALKNYLEARGQADPNRPTYLSYFGNGGPAYHSIQARLLPGWGTQDPAPAVPAACPAQDAKRRFDQYLQAHPEFFLLRTETQGSSAGETVNACFVRRPEYLRIREGAYCISATMLQPVYYKWASGPWCKRLEDMWQGFMPLTRALAGGCNEAELTSLLASWPLEEVTSNLEQYLLLRQARLCAFLRQREPTANVNYSILVFDLSDQEVRMMLEGPPPPLGPDLHVLLGDPGSN